MGAMILFDSFLIICKMVHFHGDTYLISLCKVCMRHRELYHSWCSYEEPLCWVMLRVTWGESQLNVSF